MAPNATIFKATLHIADIDQHYYEDHTLTLARHPSETDERMMVRLLAFALHAHEDLAFGRGIGTDGEPALWQKDLTGAIDLWIEVGEPDDKILRQACGRATRVIVYSYGGKGADRWWEKTGTALSRCTNLTVVTIPQDGSRALAQLAQRSMDLHCSIQEGQIFMGDGTTAVQLALTTLSGTAP
ncbi:hypothetical protein B566_EDAN000573 [Ephemera danica]|nr:hypothetical protein B566_EDAN000573 [Ephemera danica]